MQTKPTNRHMNKNLPSEEMDETDLAPIKVGHNGHNGAKENEL